MPHSIMRVDVAGRDVTRYLRLLLRKEGVNFRTTAEFEIVRQIKVITWEGYCKTEFSWYECARAFLISLILDFQKVDLFRYKSSKSEWNKKPVLALSSNQRNAFEGTTNGFMPGF